MELFGFAFLSILFCFIVALGRVGRLRVLGIGAEVCRLNLGWRFVLLDCSMCLGYDVLCRLLFGHLCEKLYWFSVSVFLFCL